MSRSRTRKLEKDCQFSVPFLYSLSTQSSQTWLFLPPMPFNECYWFEVVSRWPMEAGSVFVPRIVIDSGDDVRRCLQRLLSWMVTVEAPGELCLVGQGLGSLMIHGLVPHLAQRRLRVYFYEAYWQSIQSVGLLAQQWYTSKRGFAEWQPLLSWWSEGLVADEHLQRCLDEEAMPLHQQLLDDIFCSDVVARFSCQARSVYQRVRLPKTIAYGMPGFLQSLSEVDAFLKAYPSVHVEDWQMLPYLAALTHPQRFLSWAQVSVPAIDANAVAFSVD